MNPGRVQQKVLKKRLTPTEVLRLIEGCNLARDAFLIVPLYNTGLLIGEALGLQHINMLERVICERTTPRVPTRVWYNLANARPRIYWVD